MSKTLKNEVTIEEKGDKEFVVRRVTEQEVGPAFILQAEQQHKSAASQLQKGMENLEKNYEKMRKDMEKRFGKEDAEMFMEFLIERANLAEMKSQLEMEKANLGRFIKPASKARKLLKLDAEKKKRGGKK